MRRKLTADAIAKLPADVNEWGIAHAVNLGIDFVPAVSGQSFCKDFGEGSSLPQSIIDLESPSSALATSLDRWITAMNVPDDGEGGELDAAVDHFVGEVLHAANLDGDGLVLLPQRNIRARIESRTITTRPDFLVRDMDVVPVIDVVTHDSKAKDSTDLAWAQIGGEMLVAAISNAYRQQFQSANVDMVGIRAIGTRFTFFKGSFDGKALYRLSSGLSEQDDRFPIDCWGGDAVDRANPQSKLSGIYWGLDFRVPSERKQLLRMVAALGREIRARRKRREAELL